ncbi:hypothetical protein RF819_11530 [Rhodoferax fermentans]|uniref:Right handed beta helix domain-containing protein n=1 Tax=Rhodoferax fermentans TaxID=28066 RepID=A0A1T1AYC9_RHOFE|nr:hypothetical protein RF819_11530 [Rhodoferax fermentans]
MEPLATGPTDARVLRVGPAQAFSSIAAAAAKAKDGDTVEIDAGDYVGDVAVWNQNRLTLRGMGGPVKLMAGGKSAQGKAIWVIRGTDVLVENIQFSGAKVRDGNGAGIRFEAGRLTVKNCTFTHNENGILTANEAQAELVIENSEFGYNGAGDGYSHNLYVGHIKKFTVTGSYFHHAKTGHLLKSRASENLIFYNRLTDETGGTASYELDLPNGGLAYVVGNIVQQSSTTSNNYLITFGEEGYTGPHNELYLNHNTLVDDSANGGFFLRYAPGLQRLLAANNMLVGDGPLDGSLKKRGLDLVQSLLADKPALAPSGPAAQIDISHNVNADWSDFIQASRFDYRPKGGTFSAFKPRKLDPVNGVSMQLSQIFAQPVGIRQLILAPQYPGAVQP